MAKKPVKMAGGGRMPLNYSLPASMQQRNMDVGTGGGSRATNVSFGGFGGPSTGSFAGADRNMMMQNLDAAARMPTGMTSGMSTTPTASGVGLRVGRTFAKGGKVTSSSASKRADGIAQKGKTKGMFK
jgi:hypothetical protein